MALYYFPLLIRSDRYFIARLEKSSDGSHPPAVDFNFVIPAGEHVVTPLVTLDDPGRIVLNQMAPSDLHQDIPLTSCRISAGRVAGVLELRIEKSDGLRVEPFEDTETGIRLDYVAAQKRIILSHYVARVTPSTVPLCIRLVLSTGVSFSAIFHFTIAPARECHRAVIDFGSEASQVAWKTTGPQVPLQQFDILDNVINALQIDKPGKRYLREEFLNDEAGQPTLYRSFYAVRKRMNAAQRANFPFNFNDNIDEDEVRLFITRQEVSATESAFGDDYEIIPNLKLGMERNLRLIVDRHAEEYSTVTHKTELISAILLRLLRMMIGARPEFRQGGLIVTLLVPNIYTQHEVFDLLNELRNRTPAMLKSLQIQTALPAIEFETISESDAAFMGFQQTHGAAVRLSNGDMALVIDCGKGTTDISILLADDHENYSSFFRTGFAGAGNVLSYGFAEDLLTLLMRTLPGHNGISIRDFVQEHILAQHLTVDVLDFIHFLENQKKRFHGLQVVGIGEFSRLTEPSEHSERTIATLHRDPATVLSYATSILKDRNIRWDSAITGLIDKACDCIVYSILESIKDVITRDIRKRIKMVMLSGRGFYFEDLQLKTRRALQQLLQPGVPVHTVLPGRALNNKNVAIYGAVTGAYKITDFTGIPVDKKDGLTGYRDVLKNNAYLYRGIKIEPGHDILYNAAVVRRNDQQLKIFHDKAIDMFFTRDNIYLRLMENQKVRYVGSLYNLLTSGMEARSAARDMKAISMFPNYRGELTSVSTLRDDLSRSRPAPATRKKSGVHGILQFFQF